MENILRPIIEGAGYRVISDGSAEAADVVIASAEGEVPTVQGRLLKIRATPEAAEGKADSIYRYDRAGLMSALSRHAEPLQKGRA
jgi:two-component system chemotaxis sensor kinase CheA